MKFLILAVALCVTVTTVYGNPKSVKCYVCQWTSLTGYTSPFTQNDCTDAGLKKFPRAFVQECDNGCGVSKLKENGVVISEKRVCSPAPASHTQRIRYCSGDDCNKDFTTAASAVTPPYTRSKCRQIAPNSGGYLVNFTDIYQNVSRVATNCTTGNTPEKHQYCSISEIKKDKVSNSMMSSYATLYQLGCQSVIKAEWSGLDYLSETKLCMNNFCNQNLDDGAVDPTTTVEPSTTPEPTKSGGSLRPAAISVLLLALLARVL